MNTDTNNQECTLAMIKDYFYKILFFCNDSFPARARHTQARPEQN